MKITTTPPLPSSSEMLKIAELIHKFQIDGMSFDPIAYDKEEIRKQIESMELEESKYWYFNKNKALPPAPYDANSVTCPAREIQTVRLDVNEWPRHFVDEKYLAGCKKCIFRNFFTKDNYVEGLGLLKCLKVDQCEDYIDQWKKENGKEELLNAILFYVDLLVVAERGKNV